jgi:hypothetical protein
MEHSEQYYNRDMWPPENDRALMFRLASDVPVLQNTLIRIFVIGLSKVIIKYIHSVYFFLFQVCIEGLCLPLF